MKRVVFVLSALLALVAGTSACKSQQEAYNAAYERAKAQQALNNPSAGQTIEVVEKKGVKEASETLDLLGASAEGTYGVVIGSFINRTNAENLQKRMVETFPHCVLGQNEKLMYRVIVEFYSVKADAQAKVGELKEQFPDAWILIKE